MNEKKIITVTILDDANCQKALLYLREMNRITYTCTESMTALVHSYKIKPPYRQKCCINVQISVWKDNLVPILAKKKKKVSLFKVDCS